MGSDCSLFILLNLSVLAVAIMVEFLVSDLILLDIC